MSELDQVSINALRFLAVDAVEKAKSGHPGAPLGDAPAAYLLFHKFMRHNPKNPKWTNRDRFVLSNGHASALLYSVLHLSGYDLSIEDLQQFRQYESLTPGHPELGDTPGVEVTTGPLGQGFAMGVGMAIAEKHLAAVYNRPDFDIVDHYTYVMCSDGDLMEGVSHEAASLAGTLALGKMIYLYDDNLISLDGPTELSYTEDVTKRFEAYHWHVQMVEDGNDLEAISKAIEAAKSGHRQAIAHPLANHHRLRQPQSGHQQSAWGATGRRSSQGDQAEPELARGQDLLRSRGCQEALAHICRERQEVRTGVERDLRPLQEVLSRTGG